MNNAGIGVIRPLVEMDRASVERVFATNVIGAMLMAREAAKHFIERKSGNIINIGSTAAVRGAARGTAYYGSKFALRGMTECWRAELRHFNVRVMLVNPSEVLTDFYATAGLPQNKQNPTKLRGERVAHAVRSALEMDDRGFITELTVFATNPKTEWGAGRDQAESQRLDTRLDHATVSLNIAFTGTRGWMRDVCGLQPS